MTPKEIDMQNRAHKLNTQAPWYTHRWPWLLMLGPLLVMVAGTYTAWLSFSRQDALVVDDYYKQGKAINQDLRRDRAAAGLKMRSDLRYDVAKGMLSGTIFSLGQPQKGAIVIHLVHSTQPEKDIRLQVQPDDEGRFAVGLPLLDIARWQVLVEGERRDWRLLGIWTWPQQKEIELSANVEEGEAR
jgi:uncharacterized protein